MRALRRFLRFWYDFLVGDRWELFLGPIGALLAARLIAGAGFPGIVSGLLLFGLVVAVGGVSIGWALRS
jgi:hypothetical protein